MRHLLYIVGQPGSGKSTLVEALTLGLRSQAYERPFAHIVWAGAEPVVELGARREKFSGTDALSLSVQPLALAYLRDCPARLMLAEGDRLANLSFLTAARTTGWDVTVARLGVSAAVADFRRRTRAAGLGTVPQNEAWIKGRVSKVNNLITGWGGAVLFLDGDQPTARVLAELQSAGNPVVAALTG